MTGRLIHEKDWSTTSLGPRESWPRSLNNYLSMILGLPTAAIIFWGCDQVQLYNDGYSIIMGPRHPRHLGSTFRACWPEAYPTIDPWMRRVLQHGETVEVNRTLVPLTRFGFTEEAYFTFSFSPLRDDHGRIAGILQLVTEVTDAVLGERRARALHELSNQTAHAKTMQDAARLSAEVLEKYQADLAFCLIYVVDPADRQKFVRAASTGLSQDDAFPSELFVHSDAALAFPEAARAIRERQPIPIDDLATRFSGVLGADTAPPTRALVAPIAATDQQHVVALLVSGVSARLSLDDHYQSFLRLVCDQLATLMAAARAYDDERRRAQALTEIDRAKTEFFSNVSHEFRTPLTLILGPLEDALADSARALHGDALAAVHRNALRLLKLVNTLLDFAHIEANRLSSAREATDLAALTAGLAGSFQSLLESAGLRLRVDCPPLSELVYVDRWQWERIVLNLISNAFKFTFEGVIAVRLYEGDGLIHLSVSDTGTGIPAEELPKIFERFHRVKSARGRSFEGTGIGLALVRELVEQHAGSIQVVSVVDQGTTFVVSIPRRTDQAACDQVSSEHGSALAASPAPYVLEAARWNVPPRGRPSVTETPDAEPELPAQDALAAGARAHILVVDDNADMREYLARLLSPRWSVETAEDGQAALEAALRRAPDLILSDVMMPRLDGAALVGALRANAKTSTVPVVLLSARAGEEAVVGGLDMGADDYLVKPFATRELLARVQAHLQMARLRRAWARQLEYSNQELEAFSYSVSHDLRAPLRAIDGFSKILVTDYSDRLDGEGCRYLDRIRSATERMAQLIDDLLGLARVTRAPLVRARVDVTGLARKILIELGERGPERSVEAVVAEGLEVQADPRLVAVVMENLLGNAWKFSSRQPFARIEVGRELRRDEAALFVRDNGVGFDMEYAQKLFAPFQRLHAQDEFEGTGIGLATVRRVVTRHGGRIWSEAAPGRGATFYFTFAEGVEPRQP